MLSTVLARAPVQHMGSLSEAAYISIAILKLPHVAMSLTQSAYSSGMRTLAIFVGLALSSCGSTASNPLLENDWTNGKQPCSESRLSFKDGRIGYHVKDRQIWLFDIERLEPLQKNPEIIMVLAKPAQQLRENLATRGLTWAPTERPRFIFRVHDHRLSLLALSRPGEERLHAPSAEQARRFDLVACPA